MSHNNVADMATSSDKPPPTRRQIRTAVSTRVSTIRVMIKRVYEPASKFDGVRVLVDRLWPRGISKKAVKLDLWLPDLGPSTGLRQWFKHDPARWKEFQQRYHAELNEKTALTRRQPFSQPSKNSLESAPSHCIIPPRTNSTTRPSCCGASC